MRTLAMLCTGVALLGCDSAEEKQETACADQASAFSATQELVKSRLRAPATAAFPAFGEDGVKVEQPSECRQYIEAFVDAQNIYGATVRLRYYAMMDLKDPEAGWTVDILHFDSETEAAGVVLPQ